MDVTEIYSVGVGSLCIVVLGWHLMRASVTLRRRLISIFRKSFFQTVIFTRRRGSSDYTVASCVVIMAFLTGNILAGALCVRTRMQLRARLRALFLINLLPLFVGGRTNILVSYFLGVSTIRYNVFHRSLGWICIVQGVAYGCLTLLLQGWTFRPVQIITPSLLAAVALTSILYFRRLLFEVFLKLHFLLVLALLISLWKDTHLDFSLATVCLGVSSTLWALHHSIWAVRYCWMNLGGRFQSEVDIVNLKHGSITEESLLVEIRLRRPVRVRGGQYVYITMPSTPHRFVGRLQSHPYFIAWAQNDDEQTERVAARPRELEAVGRCFDRTADRLTLMIEARNGFSNALRLARTPAPIIIDGPYNSGSCLGDFDKVLFMASGVGIAAHLLAIRHLIWAHNQQSARVRRVTLCWVLDNPGQRTLAQPFLELLMNDDVRSVFTVLISTVGMSGNQQDAQYERIWESGNGPNCAWMIESEWAAEAGTMAVSLCGAPHFEQEVRKAIRNCPNDIELVTTPFQMDENRNTQRARQ